MWKSGATQAIEHNKASALINPPNRGFVTELVAICAALKN